VVIIVAAIAQQPFLILGVIFPLLFVAILLELEREVKVNVQVTAENMIFVGDELSVEARAKVTEGFGLVTLELPSQDGFEVTDGTNVHVIFKGFGAIDRTFNYKMRALRRGIFSLPKVTYTYYPSLGLLNKVERTIPVDLQVKVRPKLRILRKSQMKLKSKHVIPRQSLARLGPYSTEFLSVREYTVDDPYKFINWKASSRLADPEKLLVNEYEREGLRTFIFILDRSQSMTHGTVEENPLEYGIAYLLSYSRLLLEYGVNVGVWTMPLSRRRRDYILPNSGTEQFQRIKELLIAAESMHAGVSASYTLDPLLIKMVRETRPSIVLITNLSQHNVAELSRFSSSLLKLGAVVTLVDVMPYAIIAKYSPSGIGVLLKGLLLPSKKKQYKILPGGVGVVPWDPVTDSIGRAVRRSLALSRQFLGGT
jgi:uncharacterized protein (DUF58 family)